jgi:hypothetical protein
VSETTTDPVSPDLTTPEGRQEHAVTMILTNSEAVPAKFKNADGSVNVDALVQSYAELEKKQGTPVAPKPTTSDDDQPAASVADLVGEDTKSDDDEAVSITDLTQDPTPQPTEANKVWEAAKAEVTTTGNLTKATVEALRSAGVPDDVIVTTVNGYKAAMAASTQKAAEMVGGMDQLKATLEWAKANFNDVDRKTLVQQMQGPNAQTVLLGLHAQARAANALPSPKVDMIDTSEGGSAIQPQGKVVPFRTAAEAQTAVADPRYNTDPDYRRQVYRRTLATQGMDPDLVDQNHMM